MKTKTVDDAVRSVWAKLASAAAQRAVRHAENDRYFEAEQAMTNVEDWLNKAGANATRWTFRQPQL